MHPKRLTIALAGNPNSGKTTIFNNITGTRQKVGNWPGVTVEKKEGRISRSGYDLRIIDLPGTYSLTPFSIEEIVARNFILDETPDVVIDIIDASNLERSLYLATQLRELDCKVIFALNMADLARMRGSKIDARKLSELLDKYAIGVIRLSTDKPEEVAAEVKKLSYVEGLRTDIRGISVRVAEGNEDRLYEDVPKLARRVKAKILGIEAGSASLEELYRLAVGSNQGGN